ncbi:MAG: hypothetical protein L0338_25375 [Acidobacteria bacterium]|nr:hypothetical protein [Acidobacteriota bacterium]
MTHLENAQKLLIDTEETLRKFIESALARQCYGDVAGIARMADAILRAIREEHVAVTPQLPVAAVAPNNPDSIISAQATPKTSRKPRPAKPEFPRFEVDGDKLVKIGWSKRDKRAYEHRAPRGVVFLTFNALASKVQPNSLFTMEQVLPVTDEAGNQIPSYQAYLAIAWLRSVGVVQRRGKDGYTLANGLLEPSNVDQLWNSVPNRGADQSGDTR